MGFLDRALKAATDTKGQLDELREVRAATAVRPAERGPLDDHERHVLERARELGAPDPFALLTAAEASEVTGVPMGEPGLTYSDDMLGVAFEAHGPKNRHWAVRVSAFHAIDDDTWFDPREHFHAIAPDLDGVPVPGLGEQALAREDDLFVLAPPLLLHVEVRVPDEPRSAERAMAAARMVLGRLG